MTTVIELNGLKVQSCDYKEKVSVNNAPIRIKSCSFTISFAAFFVMFPPTPVKLLCAFAALTVSSVTDTIAASKIATDIMNVVWLCIDPDRTEKYMQVLYIVQVIVCRLFC